MDISVIFKKKYFDLANTLPDEIRLKFYDQLFSAIMEGKNYDNQSVKSLAIPIQTEMTVEIMKYYKMDFIDIWTTIWHKNPEECNLKLKYKDL